MSDDDHVTSQGMEVGDYLEGGRYEVSNVVGSSSDGGNKAAFWEEHTGCSFSDQTCSMLGCGNDAEVGGHMYVKRLSRFCWILPICQECNKNPDLDYPCFMAVSYTHLTLPTKRIV
eukprot:TRINITY_DN4399_c0_g1_i3.p1 TRINITY_DN4399_c0_g1~~TRINITY_DN4399_c0_g1_i3.p1  ORF type:complete len:116 (-),score=19.59 TRINITY_DN4399_c0_g1_i3:139-486(-)